MPLACSLHAPTPPGKPRVLRMRPRTILSKLTFGRSTAAAPTVDRHQQSTVPALQLTAASAAVNRTCESLAPPAFQLVQHCELARHSLLCLSSIQPRPRLLLPPPTRGGILGVPLRSCRTDAVNAPRTLHPGSCRMPKLHFCLRPSPFCVAPLSPVSAALAAIAPPHEANPARRRPARPMRMTQATLPP